MPRKEAPPVYANLRLGPASSKKAASTAISGKVSEKASERAPSEAGVKAVDEVARHHHGTTNSAYDGQGGSLGRLQDISDEEYDDDDDFPEFHQRNGIFDSQDSDEDETIVAVPKHEMDEPESFFADNSFVADS
jgi:hypothetical protein